MDLGIEVAGVKFKNPVVASAGVITRSEYGIRKCIEAGVGGVANKSITFVPTSWPLPRPAFAILDKYGQPGTSVGWELGFIPPEPGIELLDRIKPIAKANDCVLIGNMSLSGDLASFPKDEALKRTRELARQIEGAGAQMLEIARSCGIVLGKELQGDWTLMHDAEYVCEIIKTLKRSISIPFGVKIDFPFTQANAPAFEAAGVAFHSILSNAEGVAVDIETGRPLSHFRKPYHGAMTKASANLQAAQFTRVAKVPFMSAGGVMNSRDVIERLMCGASIVQSHTAAMCYGHKVYTEMVSGLGDFLKRKGYRNVRDIIGVAAPHIDNTEEYRKFIAERQVPREAMTMRLDKAKCNGCGECAETCPYGAMTMKGGLPKWDAKVCEFCGTCECNCPVDAIVIRMRAGKV